MKALVLLRTVLLALLAAAVLLPARPEGDRAGGEVARVAGGSDALERVLRGEAAPGLIVREGAEVPGIRELEQLAAAGRIAPIVVALPVSAPRLRLGSLGELKSGRAAALPFHVRGEPGDSVLVRVLEGGGALDSVRLAIAAGGEASGAFRLRPARAGWHEWRVEARAIARGEAARGRVARDAADTAIDTAIDTARGPAAVAGGWVQEGAPPRVLIAAGAPTWESRFLARALEESGTEVTVTVPLGRGVGVVGTAGSAPGAVPADLATLARHDVVLLLPGTAFGATSLAALERYVAEVGGGVLVAGAEGAMPTLGLAAGWRAAGTVPGDEVHWSLPAELAPLPAAQVRGMAVGVEAARPGVAVAGRVGGSGEGEPLLLLRPLGRGRTAALGLQESWRWRMEAGRIAEHREFWRSLVDWLAGGVRDSLFLQLPATGGVVGAPVEVRVKGASPATPPRLALTRPDASAEMLALAPVPEEPGALRATFVPEKPGVHTLAFGDGPVRGALRVTNLAGETRAALVTGEVGAHPDGWARLALLADRSGGAALAGDAMDAWVAQWNARQPQDAEGRGGLRLALFAAIALVALAEWSLRRFRGRA